MKTPTFYIYTSYRSALTVTANEMLVNENGDLLIGQVEDGAFVVDLALARGQWQSCHLCDGPDPTYPAIAQQHGLSVPNPFKDPPIT